MKYRTYKLNMESIARLARKGKSIKVAKRDKGMDMLRKAMRWLYMSSRQMLTTMECVIHAEEYYWLTHGKTVYFPIDKSMAENIIKGSFKVNDEWAIYDGPESFILNLPEGLAFIGNDSGSGLMVNVSPHDDRAKDVYGNFMDWLELPPVDVEVDHAAGHFTIMIEYQENMLTDVYMRVAIPSFNAVRVLQMSALEYAAYMEESNRFKYHHGLTLNDVELKYQYEVMRFVCGFMVYKKALPDRVVSGLPGTHLKGISTPVTKDRSDYLVKHPEGAHEPSEGHYRTWHFRQLMNERYYRGQYRHLPQGSRVVFVSDSFVVRDIDAKTVRSNPNE